MKGDGGPAFPIVGTTEDVNVNVGMSLRDYFAAAALTGYLASYGPQQSIDSELSVAGVAYRIADAMLALRAIPPAVPRTPERRVAL